MFENREEDPGKEEEPGAQVGPGGDPSFGFSQSLTSRHEAGGCLQAGRDEDKCHPHPLQCSWGRAVAPVVTLMRLGNSREPACPGEPRGERTLQITVLRPEDPQGAVQTEPL